MNELRWGYTLTDLHRYAQVAVAYAGPAGTDHADRYDEACSAIAEALYAAQQTPTEHDLIAAGRNALWSLVKDHRRHHGYFRDRARCQHGAHSAPNFRRYWLDRTWSGSPEGRIVETAALHRILPSLAPRQREVVHALAAFGDHATAARALGMTYTNFIVTLSHARRRFLYWWHEGELPSRPWGTDRRGQVRNATEVIRKRRAERRTSDEGTRVLRPTDRTVLTYVGDRVECPAGHAYDAANTYVDKLGHRHCRRCKKDRRRAAALEGRRI